MSLPNIYKGSGIILVVDDDPLVQRVAQKILETVGYTVLSARDGVQAMDLFKEHHQQIRAVLLDVAMPRKTGDEVISEMRAINKDMKVILISGLPEENVIERFMDKRIDGYLTKPFSLKNLCSVLYNTPSKDANGSDPSVQKIEPGLDMQGPQPI